MSRAGRAPAFSRPSRPALTRRAFLRPAAGRAAGRAGPGPQPPTSRGRKPGGPGRGPQAASAALQGPSPKSGGRPSRRTRTATPKKWPPAGFRASTHTTLPENTNARGQPEKRPSRAAARKNAVSQKKGFSRPRLSGRESGPGGFTRPAATGPGAHSGPLDWCIPGSDSRLTVRAGSQGTTRRQTAKPDPPTPPTGGGNRKGTGEDPQHGRRKRPQGAHPQTRPGGFQPATPPRRPRSDNPQGRPRGKPAPPQGGPNPPHHQTQSRPPTRPQAGPQPFQPPLTAPHSGPAPGDTEPAPRPRPTSRVGRA